MRSRLFQLIATVALVLIVAACADDGEAVDATTPQTTPTTAAGQPDAGQSDAGQPGDTVIESTAPPEAAPTTVAAAATPAATADIDNPTGHYSTEVQPILEGSCVSCHTAGGPGSSHFDLNTAGDAQTVARDIGIVTTAGYMPPWPASELSVPFHEDRSLTPNQIEALRLWVEGGATLDVDAGTPLVASAKTVPEIERDRVLTAEPYKGSVDKVDDYRCQVYDPELTETSFLQNYALEPDQTPVVHHALVFAADAALREQALALDAADPAVGWSCFGLSGLGNDQGSSRQIMGWAPGQQPTIFPADTGIRMEPGDFIVMQIHYHYESKWADLPADESAIVLDFADDDVIEAAGGQLDELDLTLYLGPAEIPCLPDETGPLCDRDAAIAKIQEEEGGFAGAIANLLHRQCGTTPEQFAVLTDGIASSSCDLDAQPGQIVSIFGHEHEIGTSVRMTLNPGRDDERILLDIPRWDFDWQLNYYPTETIVLQEGDSIRIECSWDRAKVKAGSEPRYILWADGTEDEMCYSQIFTRPVS